MNKPNAKEFHTNDGMHSAMRLWAKCQSKFTLSVAVVFSDYPEQTYTDTFERAQVERTYKTLDGETYTVSIDSGKFKNTFMAADDELTATELKAAFAEWVKPLNPQVTIVSLKWKKEPVQ